MILVDFNQITYATIQTQLYKESLTEDVLRHMVLNCLRAYRSKWGNEYGEMVLAVDSSTNYWRRTIFPYYKAARKERRDASSLDWPTIFATMDKIKAEIRETFPYKYIEVEGAEADDVIATLVRYVGDDEKILILSSDNDFIQLHKSNVVQYDPARSKWIQARDPKLFLIEHILKGDYGDGIPNVRSSDNALALKIKQGPITQKFLANFDLMTANTETVRNYHRNEMLIDLSNTPEEIKRSIIEMYNTPPKGDRSKLFQYFFRHKLKNLMSSIQDF